MGIVDLQVWVRKRFPKFTYRNINDALKIIRKGKGKTDTTGSVHKKVRRLFLDFNALIHEAKKLVYEDATKEMREHPEMYWETDGGMFDTIMDFIEELLIITQPTHLLYIASDGVVTKAKMMEQRTRSLKSVAVSSNLDRNNVNINTDDQANSSVFKSNHVKPGSEFMGLMNVNLRRRLNNLVKKNYLNIDLPAIEFSDSSLDGEGEHKIMERLLKGRPKRNREFDKAIDVIYSPDSDVHLLAMMHQLPADEVLIMRHRHTNEGQHFELEERYEYFNTTKIKNAILGIRDRDIPVSEEKNGKTRRNYNIYHFKKIEDFVLISIFAGNDFLPSLPFGFMTGIDDRKQLVFDYIVRAYTKTFRKGVPGIYMGGKILWDRLLLYVRALSEESTEMMQKVALFLRSNPDKFVDSETGEDRSWVILQKSSTTRKDGESVKFNDYTFQYLYKRWVAGTYHNRIDVEREEMNFDIMDDMINNYLEGISWVMSYYRTQNNDINTTWSYNHHYAPDLLSFIEYLENNLETPELWTKVPHFPIKTILSPLEHLVSIITYNDIDLLPRVVSVLFLDQMPHIFVKKIFVDQTMIKFGDYKGKSIINFPSIAEVQRIFNVIRDLPTIKARNGMKNYFTKIKGVVRKKKDYSNFGPTTIPEEDLEYDESESKDDEDIIIDEKDKKKKAKGIADAFDDILSENEVEIDEDDIVSQDE